MLHNITESGAWRAQCEVLEAAPKSTLAVVWGQTGVAFQRQFAQAGCAEQAAIIENRSIIVSFEPLFLRTTAAACPRVVPPPAGPPYLAVPWPTQFHAASDRDISEHLASLRRLARPYLMAFYGGEHGRQASLRHTLHEACRDAASRCVSLHVPGCASPRFTPDACLVHAAAENGGGGAGARNVTLFEHLLAGYASSEFCLMPAGDTPTRQGIFDALLTGCIPVFFTTCRRGALYESAYEPFVPRYERHNFGAGAWAVLLNASEVAHTPGVVVRTLEAIGVETRLRMREAILRFLPRLAYAHAGARLRRFEDARSVFRSELERRLQR